MARIRSIKPEFFRHYDLWLAEKETGLPLRMAFVGLWCVADREGRFKWCPPQLKIEVLPYDELDFSRVLDALTTRGFVVRYRVDEVDYGYIPTFSKHQVINNRERASELPEPNKINTLTRASRVTTRDVSVEHACPKEGKGREERKKDAGDRVAALDFPSTGPPTTEDADLFRRGKELLGKDAGSFIAKLKKSQKGNVALTRALLETASTKDTPREYLARVIRGKPTDSKVGADGFDYSWVHSIT